MTGPGERDRPVGDVFPVLLYHSIAEQASPPIAPFTVTPRDFHRHLDLIQDAGCNTLTVASLVERLSRREQLPPHLVVLTFDDGYADTLLTVAPELAARGLAGTAFISTGWLGEDGKARPHEPGEMLDWDRVADLEAAGLEIGCHAHTHMHLDVLPRAAARTNIRLSKSLLEERLDHRIQTFAYPHGYNSPWLRAEVEQAGFDSACGVRNALSHSADDRWCIARLTVRADTPFERFAAWLAGDGAPIAGAGEALRTAAWRNARKAYYRLTIGKWKADS